MPSRAADYIVVGAGAAGCIVAARLSEDPNVRVILIEAGAEARHIAFRIPAFAHWTTSFPAYNWYFESEPVPALEGRRLRFQQGRGIGGSGLINSMVYTRGHPAEYDRWGATCPGWSYREVLPYFTKAEKSERGASAVHGVDGPIPTRPSDLRLPVCEAFLAAGREGGIPTVDDLNAGVAEGFGYFDVNGERGWKVPSVFGHLAAARPRPNLEVLASSAVARIAIDRGRATGVTVANGGAQETIRAEREVIVCAGSLNSPQLLMLSGIGPADHLREHGIEVVADAPGVGDGLQNHPAYALQYGSPESVSLRRYTRFPASAHAALRYAATGSGPLAESLFAAGGVIRTDSADAMPDVIVMMVPALQERPPMGARLGDFMPVREGFTVVLMLGRPKSRGRVRLRSADPTAAPLIFPNYFDDGADMQAMLRGVRRTRELMRGASIARFVTAELEPGAQTGDDDSSIVSTIRAKTGTAHHPNGTCRMGTDSVAVVDPQLRVRGIAGLRVADVSVVPDALCACTHAAAIMIGEKAAATIAAG